MIVREKAIFVIVHMLCLGHLCSLKGALVDLCYKRLSTEEDPRSMYACLYGMHACITVRCMQACMNVWMMHACMYATEGGGISPSLQFYLRQN